MSNLFIDFESDKSFQRLDTIEERSQECTPVFEFGKDWAKLQTGSVRSGSDLERISEVDDDENAKNAENSLSSAARRKAIREIFFLVHKSKQLERKLSRNYMEITAAETENSQLQRNIYKLENEENISKKKSYCRKECMVF